MVGSQGGTMPSLSATLAMSQPLFYSTNQPREVEDLEGDRCWTIAHDFKGGKNSFTNPDNLWVLGDSGAFSHDPSCRWALSEHRCRLLQWEQAFSRRIEYSGWQFRAVSSYDVLIDETWVNGIRNKQRWTPESAQWAVTQTIQAAQYLAAHRQDLAPRTLVLGCQGVNADQYEYCVEQILQVATSNDWIALGGWCIIGQQKHYLIEFYEVLRRVIPKIAHAGVRHIHLFGVLYEPAIAPFHWICQQYGLTCSTDSARPIINCITPSPKALKRAGALAAYWKDNVLAWKEKCAVIDKSRWHCQPSKELAYDTLRQERFVIKVSQESNATHNQLVLI